MKRHPSKRMSGRSMRGATSRTTLLRLTAVLAVVIVAMAGLALGASSTAEQDQARAKRYKATRAFVVDKETRAVRMPTQQEVDDVVATMAALGQRPAEDLSAVTEANNALTVDLSGGYNGIFLARPRADGGWETKCVFTVEEGAEFLGLVEDESAR